MKRALATVFLAPLLLLLPFMFMSQEQTPDIAPAASGYGDGLNTKGIPKNVVQWILKSTKQCEEITAPLLAAQLKAESNFQPRAGSPAGAQGIAQFMPGTFKTWGKDSDNNGRTSVYDIGDAIMAQGKFMCALYRDTKKFPGDKTDLALAAYNAGPGAVSLYGGVPPYSETQAYVKRIKGFMKQFTAAATGPVSLPIDPKSPYRNLNNFGGSGSMWARQHTGDDLSAPCGTRVLAATAGRIIVDHTQSWAGPNLVKVSTGPGRLTTWYAHMMRISVKDGDHVKPGQPIGFVGQLGNASGCHLHFEYHPRGGKIYDDPTDPVPWLRKSGVKLR